MMGEKAHRSTRSFAVGVKRWWMGISAASGLCVFAEWDKKGGIPNEEVVGCQS